MYSLLTGPFLWLVFTVFIGGTIFRLVTMVRLARKERVVIPYMNLYYGLRSIIHWLTPFGSLNMKMHPVMTVVTFAFHCAVVVTPLLLLGHIVYWDKSWGISWWSLPALLADFLTLVVIASSIYFLYRRLTRPEVKYVTEWTDYFFLVLVFLTFATGFIVHHQLFLYPVMFYLHILSGGAMLISIPLTRLSHMIYFFFTRAYMGSEFGYVRNSRDW